MKVVKPDFWERYALVIFLLTLMGIGLTLAIVAGVYNLITGR
jgi:hypothetical protein